jgi:hypothetical protein
MRFIVKIPAKSDATGQLLDCAMPSMPVDKIKKQFFDNFS